MKNSVLFICFFAVAVLAKPTSRKWEPKLHKHHDECETNPETSHLDDSGQMTLTSLRAHSLCITVKAGIQKENGDVDKEQLKKLLGDDPEAEKILRKCGDRKGDSAPEAGMALFFCLNNYM